MNIINNRYKVLNKLDENKNFSSYLVEDLFEANCLLELYMFERDIFPAERYEFLKHYFSLISSFSSVFFMKNITFSSVQTIDGIKKDGSFLFCCVEYAQDVMPITEWLAGKDIWIYIAVTEVIFKAINYVGLRSLHYSSFRIEDLLVQQISGEYRLRHRDLLRSEILTLADTGKPSNFEKKYYLTDSLNWQVDMQELAYMLLGLLEGKGNQERSDFMLRLEYIRKRPNIEIEKKDEIIFQRYLEFITKLYQGNWNNSFEFFYKVYAEFADQFILSPEIEISEKKDLLSDNNVMIGRHIEIKKIYDVVLGQGGQDTSNVMLVEGGKGVGKTRLLREVRYLLNVENILTVSSFRASRENPHAVLDDFFKAYADLLMSFYFGEKRREYLTKLEEINNRFALGLTHERHQHEFKMILQATNLIFQSMRNQKLVFIVDNIEFLDDASLDFMLYLLTDHVLKEKITLVLTLNEHNVLPDSKTAHFLTILHTVGKVADIKLGNFELRNVKLMIKSILLTQSIEDDLVRHIYLETSGNPGMISRMLREYVLNDYLEINRITGRWSFAKKKLEQQANTTEEAETIKGDLLEQISERERRFLEVTSCFFEVATLEKICMVSSLQFEEGLNYAKYFKTFDITEITSDGAEQLIHIPNEANRRKIYSQMTPQQRNRIHCKILSILNMRLDIDLMEMVMQSNAVGEKEIGVRKLFKIAESKKKSNPQSAMYLYRRILEFGVETPEQEAQIRIDLARIYFAIGHFQESLEVLEGVLKIYDSIENPELREKFIFHRARIAITSGQESLLVDCRNMLRKMEKSNRSKLAVPVYLKIIGDIYTLKGRYKEAISTYKRVIDEYRYDTDYNEILAETYRMYGKFSMGLLENSKRLEYLENSIKIYEEEGDSFSKLVALGNIGYIYLVDCRDYDNALEVFHKGLQDAQRDMFAIIEVFMLNNIGYTHLVIGEYAKAIESLRLSFWRSQILGIDFQRAEILLELLRGYLKIAEFEEVNHFWKENKEFIEKQLNGRERYKFLVYQADFSFAIGDRTSLRENVKMLCDLPYDIKKEVKEEWQMVEELSEMLLADTFRKEPALRYLRFLKSKKGNLLALDSYYRFCRYLVELRYRFHDEVLPVIEEMMTIQSMFHSNRQRIYIAYFKAMLYKDNSEERLQMLESAFEMAKKFPWELIGISICTEIAEVLQKRNRGREGLLYMAEALIRGLKILKRVPIQNREKYFNTYRLNDLFRYFDEHLDGSTQTEKRERTLEEINADLEKYAKIFFTEGNKWLEEIVSEKIKMRGLRRNISKVIKSISYNRKENIRFLLEYFAANILASEAYVLLYDGAGEYEVFTEYKPSTSRIKPQKLIHYFNKESIAYLNGFGCVREYAEISSLVSIPLESQDIRRKGRDYGYLVFISDSGLHRFEQMSKNPNRYGVSFLRALIEGYELKNFVSIDSLTGALTRKYLFDLLTQIYFKVKRKENSVIAILDLDHFKGVNDQYGHQVGDLVLKTLVQLVQKVLPPEYAIGRYGGEEFILVFENVKESKVWEYCEKIRKEMESTHFNDYPNLKVTLSMGIKALNRHKDNSVEEWIANADKALYYAKNTGRNRCCIYHDFFEERLEEDFDESDILQAVMTGDDLADGRLLFALTELVLMKRQNKPYRECLQTILTSSMELLGASESGVVMWQPNGKEVCYYKGFGQANLLKENYLNYRWIERLRKSEKYIKAIDWDDLSEQVDDTEFPLLKSVIACRIYKDGQVQGILYYKSPMIDKTFDSRDLNFANIITNVISMYLNCEEAYEED